MHCDGILFDLDGTLWDSVDEIIYTWNQVLEEHHWFRPPITRSEQESVMGLQMDEIARRLFPGYSFETQMDYMEQCIQKENAYLRQHGGTLYPRLEETLKILSKDHRLCIVSNCQKGYIEAFLAAHRLEQYFCDHQCFGDTGLSKGENNKLVIRRNGVQATVYVGDTQGDRQSAMDAGIPFVYAAYGFGTVTDYQAKVEQFSELAVLLND